MRFSSLSSGSAGNSTFLQSGDTRILIDQGLSTRTLVARLAQIGERLDDVSAILCSHSHGDHAKGIPRTVRERTRRGSILPAYFTRATAELIDWEGMERPPVKYFEAGRRFEIGDFEIMPMSTPHDDPDPVGFIVTDRQGVKAAVIMDLGFIPDAARYWMRGCHIVQLESNYDTAMLQEGSYPEHLKKRITSELGHLPNSAVREFVRNDLDVSVRHLVLCHLSRHNNDPRTAAEGTQERLLERGMKDCALSVAKYQAATPIIEV